MITVEFFQDLKPALGLSTAELLSGDTWAVVSGEVLRQQVPEQHTKAKVTLAVT